MRYDIVMAFALVGMSCGCGITIHQGEQADFAPQKKRSKLAMIVSVSKMDVHSYTRNEMRKPITEDWTFTVTLKPEKILKGKHDGTPIVLSTSEHRFAIGSLWRGGFWYPHAKQDEHKYRLYFDAETVAESSHVYVE